MKEKAASATRRSKHDITFLPLADDGVGGHKAARITPQAEVLAVVRPMIAPVWKVPVADQLEHRPAYGNDYSCRRHRWRGERMMTARDA